MWAPALRPDPPKKGLAPHLPVRWGVQQIPQYSNTVPLQLSGCTSAGRVYCGTDLAECVSAPGDFLRPQGAFLPGFYPLWGVHCSVPETPNKRNANGKCRARVWAPALRPDPPKNRPCATLVRWWDGWQIPQYRNTVVLAGVLVVRSRVRLPILDTTR